MNAEYKKALVDSIASLDAQIIKEANLIFLDSEGRAIWLKPLFDRQNELLNRLKEEE